MTKTKLYLLIGYPGAGKTTIAKIISSKTGAFHIWTDVERHKMFKEPTHSKKESELLYEKLNEAADYLLSQGRDVVFDTNFNFFADREKLRDIAKKNKAETIIIWVTTPLNVAKERAVTSHQTRNLYEMNMSEKQFDKIAAKLEKPEDEKNVIKIDGVNLNESELLKKLKLKS